MEFAGEIVVNGMNGVPIRKLKTVGLGTVAGEVGADRTYQYILTEEKMRQRLWKMKDNASLAASVMTSPPTPWALRAGEKLPRHSPFLEDGAQASQAEAPGRVASVGTCCDLPRLNVCDAGTQTHAPHDVEEHAAELERRKTRVAALRAAVLGKANALRGEIATSKAEFFDGHSRMLEAEEERKVFETASLLSLRALERERCKDSKRACTMGSPNAYDQEVAMLRLSVANLPLPRRDTNGDATPPSVLLDMHPASPVLRSPALG